MKKLFFFCLCSFLSYDLLAQPFEKKQITNFDYDSRGASFPSYPLGVSFMNVSPIFFEAHEGNSSNILMMNYDSLTDSFYNPIAITSNNFLNINPIAYAPYNWNSNINLLWQTSENGNWDIALIILTDSTINEKKILLNSPLDETNPQIVLKNMWDFSDEFNLEFVYEKNNSIYLYQQKDSVVNDEMIFNGNDSIKYRRPACMKQYDELLVGAVEKENDTTSIIVFRHKSIYDSRWSEVYTLKNSGYCDYLKFHNIYMPLPLLSFEKLVDGKRQVDLIFEFDYQNQNSFSIPLAEDSNLITSDFNAFVYGIVGKLSKNRQYDLGGPNSYKIISNDSVYVVRPYWDWLKGFYTNVSDTRIGVGNLGWEYGGAISYIIWEDSANGHINLFGVKRLDPIGDVNDKIIANNFILYQNYPNPFNPKTIIKYELLSRNFVTLKIYDVLGKEVATMANEEMDAGEYKTTFEGLNIASGIYVYRLTVGNYQLSRKMILLK